MKTDNCALLTPDVLCDLDWLLELHKAATPAEFHALNSLVEAVVFHEQLYFYDLPTNWTPTPLYNTLLQEGVIFGNHSSEVFETELNARHLAAVATKVFLDRSYGNSIIGYDPNMGTSILSSLTEYEEYLGFDRMSHFHDDNQEFAIFVAKRMRFSREDAIVIDDTYRRARAFATCASELNLEMYTGIITRPLILGFLSERRRGSLHLYEQMKRELDDVDDTDIPSWRRIEIPPLTQILLQNCGDSPQAIPSELLKLRDRLVKFRKTLTEQAEALRTATSRGEKRKIRQETKKAWDALLEKQNQSTRITHQLWDILKNPLEAHIAAIDKLVEKDKVDQATMKVQGLTDLWRTLYDAPTIEQNVTLIKKLFNIDVQFDTWYEFANVTSKLESLMKRNDEPTLPGELNP